MINMTIFSLVVYVAISLFVGFLEALDHCSMADRHELRPGTGRLFLRGFLWPWRFVVVTIQFFWSVFFENW